MDLNQDGKSSCRDLNQLSPEYKSEELPLSFLAPRSRLSLRYSTNSTSNDKYKILYIIYQYVQCTVPRAPPFCWTVSQVPVRAAGVPTPSIGISRSPPSRTLHTMTSVVNAIFNTTFPVSHWTALVLTCSHTLRRNCSPLGAYANIVKTYSNTIVLQ